MSEANAKSSGQLLAEILAGSWRPSPVAAEISAGELESLTPLLLSSGAAALAFRRVRASHLHTSPAALQLQQAYRLQLLYTALHEKAISRIFTQLRSAHIEPLLIKGWAIARLYPERGLRPLGDIDLCVHPSQFAEASAVLKKLETEECPLDLHRGLGKLDDRGWGELFERSQLLPLSETEVRVLAPEDHLRLLCVHLLKHGAWRPLWLCDIAMVLESLPANFDWALCLGRKRLRADWVACAIGLAHQLLGARVDNTPIAERAEHLPRWLVPTVIKQWSRPASPIYYKMPMAIHLRHPSNLLRGLRSRWPNPIEATLNLHGPLNEWPRWPFQLGSCLARTARFLVQLPNAWREQQSNTGRSFVVYTEQLPLDSLPSQE